MSTLVRRLRGVSGLGLAWGVSWGLIACAAGLVIGVVDPDSIDPGESPLLMGGIIGLVGFLSGLCFALLLSLAERRASILELSPGRAALWGALGAAAPLLLTGLPDGMVVVTCPLGAAFASGSVALARSAARREAGRPALLDAGPRAT